MTDSTATTERFDPLDARIMDDPYPVYARLRLREPVHLGEPPFPSVSRCYYAFRHSDVSAIVTDPRLGRTRPGQRGQGPADPRWVRRLGRSMVFFNDPPEHTRIRGLVGAAFDVEFVRGLEPLIRSIAARLLASLPEDEPFDLQTDFAQPLPVLVIAGALGLPDDDFEQIRDWSHDLIGVVDPRGSGAPVERAARSSLELLRYLRERIPERRRNPGDDLLSRLLAVRKDGDRLTEDEVAANAMFLLSAGHETTMGLLGNGLLALLRNPDEWRRLRAEPALIPTAVEELLRYDSPLQMTFRFAREPVSIGDQRVEVGDAVAAVLGSANRDPSVFEDPDRLDVGRRPNSHLAFSAGAHFCMGSGVARMEAKATLEGVLARFPHLELAGRPVRRETVSFRSLLSLPVASAGRR